MQIIHIDLNNEDHVHALLGLMNDYMTDPMGGGQAMNEDLPTRLIDGLRAQNNYKGFLLLKDGRYAALANCFINFSTFKAKQLINIHDFVVNPTFRKQGLGEALLNAVANFARENEMCRVSLEVREDNPKAMRLYKKMDFKPCEPNMYFWEKHL